MIDTMHVGKLAERGWMSKISRRPCSVCDGAEMEIIDVEMHDIELRRLLRDRFQYAAMMRKQVDDLPAFKTQGTFADRT